MDSEQIVSLKALDSCTMEDRVSVLTGRCCGEAIRATSLSPNPVTSMGGMDGI